ncbi:KDEL motif-containing 1 [Chlorella sorokiniana]|uniref:KDEL motif-containing 1 n=1 Tax=Chlorella sorokiniana TaxID=3076 RepID=A0A2P6TV51_CHLSO|nr:KDEL motif-containing 1 [Chlorella sorokiniana]|eukprot:PRW57939.1 KDEL motif-containing 1 [Chlorella sorokiniana]
MGAQQWLSNRDGGRAALAAAVVARCDTGVPARAAGVGTPGQQQPQQQKGARQDHHHQQQQQQPQPQQPQHEAPPLGRFRPDGYDLTPWEQKEERAIGRWTLFPTWNRGANRWGQEPDSREWYVNHSVNMSHNTALNCLQTVIKQDSQLIEFYYRSLQPWVHYVPTGYWGPEEIDRIVQHDQLARWIAGYSQRFAATHLVSEGRHCFIKVLFEEMARLMTYTVDSLEEFPARITYTEDKGRFLLCKECMDAVGGD